MLGAKAWIGVGRVGASDKGARGQVWTRTMVPMVTNDMPTIRAWYEQEVRVAF